MTAGWYYDVGVGILFAMLIGVIFVIVEPIRTWRRIQDELDPETRLLSGSTKFRIHCRDFGNKN